MNQFLDEDVMGMFSDNTITTKEVDDAVDLLAKLREDYAIKKQVSNEAGAVCDAHELLVLDLLTRSGKSKYFLDGVGTVTKVVKHSVRIPQDLEAKNAMIEYFYHGDEALKLKYLTVNSQALNSYINDMKDLDQTFNLPGIGEATAREELRFKKA